LLGRILGKKTPGQFIHNLVHGPRGIAKAWKEERRFRYETIVSMVVIGLLAAGHVPVRAWHWTLLGIALVLSTELLLLSCKSQLVQAGAEFRLRHQFVLLGRTVRGSPRGAVLSWQNEASFRVELVCVPIIFGVLAVCGSSANSWLWVLSGCTGALCAEVLNTVRENTLRATYPRQPELPYVKQAFDTAAGAVGVMLLFTFITVVQAMVWL
jgi:diacylglycerol kinase